jgi:Domain of unknown function (DUF4387)
MKPHDQPEPTGRTLAQLAQVIRSKNAGPTQLTIDVFLNDAQAYALAASSPAMDCAAVAQRYGMAPQQVQRHLLADIHAIKYVLPRGVVAGSPGDGDVYGAQQHAPMLDIVP